MNVHQDQVWLARLDLLNGGFAGRDDGLDMIIHALEQQFQMF